MQASGRLISPQSVASRDRLLASEAAQCLRELSASAVIVYLHVPEDRALAAAVVAVTPLGVNSPMERVPLDAPQYATVAAYRTGRAATSHSTEILKQYPELAVLTPFPYVALATPLRSPTGPTGTLTATWPDPTVRGSDADLRFLSRTADRMSEILDEFATAGINAEPARIPLVIPGEYTEESPSTAWISAGGVDVPTAYHLHKLAVRLATVSDTDEAAKMVVERIIHGFGAQAVALSLIECDRLRVVGASGCSYQYLRALDGLPLRKQSPETSTIANRKQTIEVPGGRAVGRFEAPGAERRDHVWFILPLLVGGRAIGTCSVGYLDRRGELAGIQSPLTSLATLLGQTFDRTQVLDARRALAQQLQAALLPRMLPQVPGILSTCRYAPAGGALDLGGDWYDLIELPGGGVAAVVGDVEGHSISAAVVMGELRSAVRAFAGEGHDPTTVLARTNRLLNDLAADLLATCCCLWLDPNTGAIQVASAGHIPPLIRDEHGDYLALDMDIGPPLGVDADPVYRTVERVIRPGTLLALYTNGLPEHDARMNPAAFESVFRATDGELENLGDLLISDPSPRSAGADDMALLLLRYEGPSAEVRDDVRRLEIARGDLQGVKRSRRFLRDCLNAWGLASSADDAELLASEVVTNALIHGDSEVDFRLRRYPRYVRVEVRDCTPHPAVPVMILREEDQAEGGRGLVIVSALAAAWGNSPSGRGKTVWFEISTG